MEKRVETAPASAYSSATIPPVLLIKTQHHESSPRTPFSAVAPPPILTVSRLQAFIATLETIYEEENEEECFELMMSHPQNSSSILTSSQSSCFFEVQKPPSSYAHSWGCA
ncbi:hypothetical protein Tsubulata_042836 [Turnera subulata]|uniref:Uncharacterized protein n=1 Tax=Turnera subulata TaxID=218843 RepID=A0A9Q0GHW1_9ROSI|nr:hypothetical protein Tsubulata_042836 [Turnera subulata]